MRGAAFFVAVWIVLGGAMIFDPPTGKEPPIDPVVADEEGEVIVHLKDGQSFRGMLVKQDLLDVVIRIARIETTFKVDDVERIERVKTFDEYYRMLKAQIPADDYDDRYRLCEWIHRRGRLELAATELEALLDDQPGHVAARALLRTVNGEIEMGPGEGANEAGDAGGDGAESNHRGGGGGGVLMPTHLLTDDQVNLLKVFEVNLKNPPRLLVPREAIELLLESYAGSELLPQSPEGKRALYRKKPAEILDLMFRLQARALYGEVRVLSEPTAFTRFRLGVHNSWLLNSCATTECHGGTEAGEFFLFNRRRHDDNTVYTNFLILERTQVNDRPMLNYDHAEESALLQMGLPRDRAAHPHPAVTGWRPVFKDQSDPLFTKAVEWLESMYRPRPEYPVDYTPPRIRRSTESGPGESAGPGEATTEPAGDGATPADQGGEGRR